MCKYYSETKIRELKDKEYYFKISERGYGRKEWEKRSNTIRQKRSAK